MEDPPPVFSAHKRRLEFDVVSSAEFGMMVLRSGGDYLKSSENKFKDFYIDGRREK